MRSIIFGVFQSLVVLLYILDNETNFVVQVSVFIGLLIDLWKITKVMDVRVSAGREVSRWSVAPVCLVWIQSDSLLLLVSAVGQRTQNCRSISETGVQRQVHVCGVFNQSL